LNNIIRHSGAQHVTLELITSGGEHVITLQDDGRGFHLDSERDGWPHGIMGMQHRVRALGGQFSLASAPGHGTTLRVVVPAQQNQ